jgi:uncharacterized protein YuzE
MTESKQTTSTGEETPIPTCKDWEAALAKVGETEGPALNYRPPARSRSNLARMIEKQFAEHDEMADVLYVTLLDEEEVDGTVELDDLRMIDYTADRRVVGVEFISPSAGIDLHDIPFAETVEKVIGLSGYQFKVIA